MVAEALARMPILGRWSGYNLGGWNDSITFSPPKAFCPTDKELEQTVSDALDKVVGRMGHLTVQLFRCTRPQHLGHFY